MRSEKKSDFLQQYMTRANYIDSDLKLYLCKLYMLRNV